MSRSRSYPLLQEDYRVQMARRRALDRAYPLLKQAAEILELEALEPWASQAKKLRQEVGAELARLA